MKLTKNKTNWVLARADTNAEWHHVDFCIADISHIANMRRVVEESNILTNLVGTEVKVYDGYHEFFVLSDEMNDAEEIISEFLEDENNEWSYIEIEETEIQKFESPECRYSGCWTRIDKYEIRLLSYGKHDDSTAYCSLPYKIGIE